MLSENDNSYKEYVQSGPSKMSLFLHLYILVFETPLVAFISKTDRKIQASEVPKTACTSGAKYDTFSCPDCIKSYSLSERKSYQR